MSKKIALALSSGGARGLAHIGVIDEIQKRGYQIVSLSGSSMGAVVGGMYAAGTLPDFKNWVVKLTRMDVLGLIDFTLGTNGFIKGEKIFEEMQELGFIPDKSIEQLAKSMVILATDIINNKAITYNKGNLRQALRASISIPGVFTPVKSVNGLLVDGGVLYPLPLEQLKKDDADLVIAVDCNAIIPYKMPKKVDIKHYESDEDKSTFDQLKEKWYEFFEGDEKNKLDKANKLGYIDLLYRVIQVMMNSATQQAIKDFPPDVFVETSKDACGVFEFYRAKDIIALGQQACAKALDKAGL
jgi:NTE family protein